MLQVSDRGELPTQINKNGKRWYATSLYASNKSDAERIKKSYENSFKHYRYIIVPYLLFGYHPVKQYHPNAKMVLKEKKFYAIYSRQI